MTVISVLIADDHLLLRETLVHALGKQSRFAVHTAASLSEALDKISETGPFNVVLLDVVMPGMQGLPSIAEVVARNAGGAVAVMSGMIQHEFAEAALKKGAMGYIPKTLPIATLIEALTHLAQGKPYLPFALHTKAPRTVPAALSALSPTEGRALRYLCQGLSNKEIARHMNIGEVTVKTHMRAICLKLGVRNRTEAALLGAEHLTSNSAM